MEAGVRLWPIMCMIRGGIHEVTEVFSRTPE